MTFVNKSFTAGNALPALDLNQMDGNDDHVREEANYYPIVTAQVFPQDAGPDNPGYLKLMIDTTRVDQTALNPNLSSGLEEDIDITSITVGLHDISLWGYTGGYESSGGIWCGPFKFYRSPDMDYISWHFSKKLLQESGTAGEGINEDTTAFNITIIGHRVQKFW